MSQIGDYELGDELGRGSTGRVFRARHATTRRECAVKILEGDLVPGTVPEAIVRFRREAEALARVGPEVAVPVHEAGTDRGRLFYVMDLMPGGSLAARLRSGPRLAGPAALALGAKLARAVARCHAVGLVHRDLKPENVLFAKAIDDGATGDADPSQREPRLADFGSARDLTASITQTGAALGTPGYMSPEQLGGERGDARSDVYALGVLLHELVTGTRPHEATTWRELARKMERGLPAPVAATAGLPLELDGILNRTLEPDPTKRTGSAAELGRELAALLGGDVTVARESLASSLVRSASVAASPAETLAPRPRTPARRRPIALLGLGVLVVPLAILAVATRPTTAPETSPTPAASSSARSFVAPPIRDDVERLARGELRPRELETLAAVASGRALLRAVACEGAALPLDQLRGAVAAHGDSVELPVLEAVATIVRFTDADVRAAAFAKLKRAPLEGFGLGGALIRAAQAASRARDEIRARRATIGEKIGPFREHDLEPAIHALGDKAAFVAAAVAPLDSECRADIIAKYRGEDRLAPLFRQTPSLRLSVGALAPAIAIAFLTHADRWGDTRAWEPPIAIPMCEASERAGHAVEATDYLLAAHAFTLALVHRPAYAGGAKSERFEEDRAHSVATLDRLWSRRLGHDAGRRDDDEERVAGLIAYDGALRVSLVRISHAIESSDSERVRALDEALESSSAVLILGSRPERQSEDAHRMATLLVIRGNRLEARNLSHYLLAFDPLLPLFAEPASIPDIEAAIARIPATAPSYILDSARGLEARIARSRNADARSMAEDAAILRDKVTNAWLAAHALDTRLREPR